MAIKIIGTNRSMGINIRKNFGCRVWGINQLSPPGSPEYLGLFGMKDILTVFSHEVFMMKNFRTYAHT